MITALKEIVRDYRRSSHDARLQRQTSAIDAFLISYPKSGRTWLRYLLSMYLARHAGLDFDPDLISTFRVMPNFDLDKQRGLPSRLQAAAGDLPLIAVSHRDYNASLFAHMPVVMLVRDPRDVLVSSYFHQTRHKHRFEGSIGEFLESEAFGAASIAEYHNEWAEGLLGRPSLVLSYEEMSKATAKAVEAVLVFLGLPVDAAWLDEAIEKARFDKMQKKERETGIPGHEYNKKDADASRVRRGKVAGYTDYLNAEHDARIRQIFADRLNDAAWALYRPTGFAP
ncbi:sulfotransferase domain-containing protein [Parerythrobacter aurantius]|uniref:sulfotransferase domain-containing protein n=1 Tax=Parerythrobacter aurantius TaxID=3127706 RepID=UPI00324E4486